MFVYDLFFYAKDDAEKFDLALSDYFCALSGNNQIIMETLNISGNETERVARVTVPYEDSPDEKYDSPYTKRALERLSAYLKKPIERRFVGEDFTYRRGPHRIFMFCGSICI